MNRLKKLRLEKGLVQEDIGKVIGVSSQAAGQYENGKRDMSPDTIMKLADFFGVSTDYLLGYSDDRSPKDIPFVNIPIIKELKLDNLLSQDNIIDSYNLELFSGLDKDTSKYFAVEPPDNSLSPIGKGDLAIVYINNQYTSDTLYLVYLKNENRYTIKELIETKSGYELFSPNGEHLSSSKDNLVILGQIIKFEGFYKK